MVAKLFSKKQQYSTLRFSSLTGKPETTCFESSGVTGRFKTTCFKSSSITGKVKTTCFSRPASLERSKQLVLSRPVPLDGSKQPVLSFPVSLEKPEASLSALQLRPNIHENIRSISLIIKYGNYIFVYTKTKNSQTPHVWEFFNKTLRNAGHLDPNCENLLETSRVWPQIVKAR